MAIKSVREVLDGIQTQGIAESVPYSVDTAPWGGSPTSPDHDVFDEEDLTTSLKSAIMAGTPSIVADDILLPELHSLTAGVIYRITVTFDTGSATLQGFFRVEAEV